MRRTRSLRVLGALLATVLVAGGSSVLGSGSSRAVATGTAWSPDGSRIAYADGRGIKAVAPASPQPS